MKNQNKIVFILMVNLLFTGACATRTIYVSQEPPAKVIEFRSSKPKSNYMDRRILEIKEDE